MRNAGGIDSSEKETADRRGSFLAPLLSDVAAGVLSRLLHIVPTPLADVAINELEVLYPVCPPSPVLLLPECMLILNRLGVHVPAR